MISWLFFKLIDIYEYVRPQYKDFTIFKKRMYTDGTCQIHYSFNNKMYIFIGNEDEFPPVFKPGFTIPIKSATIDGVDYTDWVKKCAGPKNVLPDPKYIMYSRMYQLLISPFTFKRLLVPADDTVIHVENVLNQKHELGRKLCHQD